jgi:hypothetical protein
VVVVVAAGVVAAAGVVVAAGVVAAGVVDMDGKFLHVNFSVKRKTIVSFLGVVDTMVSFVYDKLFLF